MSNSISTSLLLLNSDVYIGLVLRNKLVESLIIVSHVFLVHFVEVRVSAGVSLALAIHIVVLLVEVAVSFSFVQLFRHFVEVELLL